MSSTIITPSKYHCFQDSWYYDPRPPFAGGGDHITLSKFATDVLCGNDRVDRDENPNWRQEVAKGLNATRPYFVTRSHCSPPHSIALVVTPNIPDGGKKVIITARDSFSYCDASGIPSDVDDFGLRDQALGRLKNRLNSNIGSASLMAPIAELREVRDSVHYLRNFCFETLWLAHDIKARKGRSVKKRLSDLWLGFSFGIKPLIADIQNAEESVIDFLTRRDHAFHVSGTANRKWFSGKFDKNVTGAYGAPIQLVYYIEHSLSYRYTGGFSTTIRSSNSYGAAEHFGLKLKDVPSVLWELTAFSWMFDYFTTTGAFLGDTFELPSGDLKYLVLDRRYRCRAVIKSDHVAAPGSYILESNNAAGSFDYFSFRRSSLTSLPHRAFRVKSIDEIGRNANNRLLNLLALLRLPEESLKKTPLPRWFRSKRWPGTGH